MEIVCPENAWEDYLYWQKNDKQKLKRINELIKDCQRNKFEGIGKPEPLKENLPGFSHAELITNTGLFINSEKPVVYHSMQISLLNIFQTKNLLISRSLALKIR